MHINFLSLNNKNKNKRDHFLKEKLVEYILNMISTDRALIISDIKPFDTFLIEILVDQSDQQL